MSKNVDIVSVVAERIKSSALGEIIDDADLYDIVKVGIEKAFFEKREVKDGWNSKYLPPLIVETLQAALKDALKPHVDKYIAENGEAIAKHMQGVVESGFINVAERLMAARIADVMRPALQAMTQTINDDRARNGMQPLSLFF